MADLPVQGIQNYGSLLSSYGEGLSNIDNAVSNNLNAQSNAAQVPSTIAARNAGTQNLQSQTTGQDLQNQQKALQLQYYSHLIDSMNSPYVNDQGTNPQNSSGLGVGMQSAASQDTASPSTPATSLATQTSHKHLLANSDGLSPGEDDLTIDSAGLDPAHIARGAQEQFGVQNVWTPAEFQQLKLAMASGVPGAADIVKQTHDARIQNATVQAQRAASKAYDNAVTIATAPPGLAFSVLKDISPHEGIATAIDQIAKTKGWSEDQKDEFTRSFAVTVGNASHRYSGRDIEVGKDGISRDKQTNQPLLGGAPEGMDAKSYQEAYKAATELVTIRNSDGSESQVPRWRASGAVSATQFINAGAGTNTLPQRGIPRQLVPATTAAPGQPAQQGNGQGQSAPADPVLRQALADPSYNLPASPIRAGVTPTPAALEQQKATVQARTELLKDSQDATIAAASSLQYLQAAKAIMQSQGKPVTGVFGPIMNEITRTYGGVNASNYQEVAKYLGQAALANAKAIYGPRMTQSEVHLQLGELSPNTKMTDAAINNLLDSNIRSSQYTIASAQRARQYLYAGKDPQQFASFNEQYFPRAQTVNQGDQQPKRPGQQLSGAGTAPPAALDLLRKNPSLAPQFKAKYGYLPAGVQ